jgi:hypothetical protein
MKKKIAPWAIALLLAISIHLLVLATSENRHWFDVSSTQPSNFELFLLPEVSTNSISEILGESTEDAQLFGSESDFDSFTSEAPSIEEFLQERPSSREPNITQSIDSEESTTGTLKASESNLLDLSNITLPSDEDDERKDVFSKELREKITVSEEVQQEYLKGQIKKVEYPITEDADGTRYVNIKGMCWRIPNPDSKEPWTVVIAGCNGQTKTFNFELNISPSMFLGEDSPFLPGQ